MSLAPVESNRNKIEMLFEFAGSKCARHKAMPDVTWARDAARPGQGV